MTSLRMRSDYARLTVQNASGFFDETKGRESPRIDTNINDECKFDEYVHLHCLQILYKQKIVCKSYMNRK